MTNGTTTQSVALAKTAGWWSGNLQYYDNPSGGFKNVVLTGGGTKNLFPYAGYYINTLQPNLALIIPALP